jgi:hypothetical protein
MLDWFDYNLMKANPDKFQALAIGKKSFDHKIIIYNIKNIIYKNLNNTGPKIDPCGHLYTYI